jgi:hypothetical protein
MKIVRRLLGLKLVTCMIGAAAVASTPHKHGTSNVIPHQFRFQFENNDMTVFELTLNGKESVPMYELPDTLLVCITECHIRLAHPDHRIWDLHMEAGETRWITSSTWSEINLTTEPANMLLVQPKRSATGFVQHADGTTVHR